MENQLIILKDEKWLKNQKVAGRCVSNILKECGKLILSKREDITLKELEDISLRIIKAYDCEPAFLNYNDFPNSICVSINNVLVHGIVTDYVLKSGDIITIDVGASYNGAIADAARTWIYGEAKTFLHTMLLEAGRKALIAGQNAVKIGNQLGTIGNAIHKTVNKTSFKLIMDYGGHGIGPSLHEPPFVANKDSKNNGIRLVNGLSIAIEPMLSIGDNSTYVGSDKFSIYTHDVSCHFENTITIMNDEIHLITEIPYEEGF